MTLLDSDDDSVFEDLFLLPELEERWKDHALQAEQRARHGTL